MIYYLDANTFVYASNPRDPYFKPCSQILNRVSSRKIQAVTSTETIQEIVFYSQKFRNINLGIAAAREVLNIMPKILPIDSSVIQRYLELVSVYPKIDSRDNLHVAVCLLNGITAIISSDRDFDKIKEIRRVDPEDFLI